MFPKQPLVIITHLDGSQILRSFYFTVIPAIPDSNCPFHLQRLQLPHFYHLLDGCSGEYCLTCKDGWYRVNYNKRHCQRKCPKGFYILGEKQKFCLRKYNNKIVSQFLGNCIEIGSRRVFHEEMTMRRSFWKLRKTKPLSLSFTLKPVVIKEKFLKWKHSEDWPTGSLNLTTSRPDDFKEGRL